ncbi:hypothetical protein ACFFRR_005461 [Megaselia abdita]
MLSILIIKFTGFINILFQNLILELGQCLPNTCTTKDVLLILKADPYSLRITSMQLTPAITVLEVRIQNPKQNWTDYRFKVFISLTICIFLIVNLATLYTFFYGHIETSNLEFEMQDAKEGSSLAEPVVKTNGSLQNGKKNIFKEILICLSIQSNIRTILNLSSRKDNLITSIHGLRVFSLLWTILVHTYLQSFFIGENKVLRQLTEQHFLYQLVGNATFSVDSFFFISGLLLTLVFYKEKKSYAGANTSYVKSVIKDTGFLIFYRYFRLTMVYLFVIFFNEFSMRYGYSDSVFKPAPHVSIENCANYWWRNILYINNFYDLNEICMIWSWYMANDMQFYIIAIVFLILSKRYFRVSFAVLSTILFSSWIVTGLISISYQYKVNVGEPFKSFNFLYDKPWQRIGSYIVGIATGYTIFKAEKAPNISKALNCCLWVCSFVLIFSTIFGVWKGELGVYESALYSSVGHTGYAVGLSWITLSCSWKITKTVNSILSYKGLLPLSRLTYCAYLLHPLIMLLSISTMEGTITLSNTIIFILFLGNVTISLIGAFIISIYIESPIIKLLKLYLKKS